MRQVHGQESAGPTAPGELLELLPVKGHQEVAGPRELGGVHPRDQVELAGTPSQPRVDVGGRPLGGVCEQGGN